MADKRFYRNIQSENFYFIKTPIGLYTTLLIVLCYLKVEKRVIFGDDWCFTAKLVVINIKIVRIGPLFFVHIITMSSHVAKLDDLRMVCQFLFFQVICYFVSFYYCVSLNPQKEGLSWHLCSARLTFLITPRPSQSR